MHTESALNLFLLSLLIYFYIIGNMKKNRFRKRMITAAAAVCISLAALPVSAEGTDDTLTDGLYSQYMIVVDADSDQVLAEKNSDERMYPASMTKMMTAIVAIENIKNYDETITITEEMIAGLAEENASRIAYSEGDEPVIRDLLYAVALPSAADATNALASKVAGGIDAYVDMMNQKAQQLGMNDTHFVNTSGLHDPDHYSTARDMAKLLNYCLQNDMFRDIFSTEEYHLGAVESFPDGIDIYSTAAVAAEKKEADISDMIGGKTGFTYEAGYCLAYWTQINKLNLIVVTGNAGGTMEDPLHVVDAEETMRRLHGWHRKTFFTAGEVMHTITVNHSFKHQEMIYIEAPEEFTLDLPEEWKTSVTCSLPDEVTTDFKEQEVTGALIVKGGDKVLYTKDFTITIPRERNFFARQWKRIKSWFSKDD